MTLSALQRSFAAYLRDEPNDALADVAEPALPNLAVYHHAYRAQLRACLRDTYAKTWAWLGDEGFDAAANAHIAGCPPSSWTLGAYGDRFALMLAMRFPDDPEIGELAALDLALRRAFDGADGPAVPLSLADIDWSCAVIRFVPTLTMLPVRTNAAAIWSALANEETPPAAALLAQPATLRIWRDGLSPRFATIEDDERGAIDAIRAGAGFSDLCDDLSRHLGVEQAVVRAAQLLSTWIADGMVASVDQT